MPDIKIKRGYEVLPDNNVRFGIRIINSSDFAISEKHTIEMRSKEVHCVCPFLKEKAMIQAEYFNLTKSGYSAEQRVNFEK